MKLPDLSSLISELVAHSILLYGKSEKYHWGVSIMSDFEKQEFHPIARVYEEYFVPALFQPWAGRVVDAARVQTGQRVLDVACGTGVVTRTAAERVGANGSVVGFDLSDGMLAVAAARAPHIEWRQGNAEALPFDDASFDAVTCQFGLMFFEDRRAALREMMRVLRPGGHLAAAVWNSLEHIPGFDLLANLLLRLFGEEAAGDLRTPFVLGNTGELQAIFAEAGIPNAVISTLDATAQFPSIESWMFTNIKGWVLADKLDDAQYELLCAEAEKTFAPFVAADGSLTFATSAHIVTATKA